MGSVGAITSLASEEIHEVFGMVTQGTRASRMPQR